MYKTKLKIGHLNARSLFTGFDTLKLLMFENDYDIFAISETWLSNNIPSHTVDIQGYKLFRRDRDGRGGGVAFYVKSNFHVKLDQTNFEFRELEHLFLEIKIGKLILALGVLYRPPVFTARTSVDCFDDILSTITARYDNIILLGDVNVNLFNLPNCISDCFDSYGFEQIVNSATRITPQSATLLDPIFVNCPELISNVTTKNADLISDHECVECEVNVPKFEFHQKFVTYRNFRNFNHQSFLEELHEMPWYHLINLNNVDDKVEMLTNILVSLFDRHAPLITVRVSKPHCPWITDVIKLMMKERDRAKLKYNLNPTPENHKSYKELRNYTLASIRREQASYLEYIHKERQAKQFWKTLSNLNIQKNKKTELPDHLSNVSYINDYFTSVYNKSNECGPNINHYANAIYKEGVSFKFKLVTYDEVFKELFSIKSNASGSDGISLTMLKMCTPTIVPYVTHIVNCCLESGYFPSAWKEALVRPVPKTASPNNLSDLRPISLLPVLSKVLEKIVYKQISTYLQQNEIIPNHQSGFRAAHSTSTALLDSTDNIIRAIDKKLATIFVALDFSKAFDTIDHRLMCAKLSYYGFDSKSQNFFHFYLSGRTQKVFLNNKTSNKVSICSGVPQGSILGPLLFIVYTADLFKIVTNCNISAYADDSNLLYHCEPKNVLEASNYVNNDLDKITKFAKEHNLKLNADKTSVIVFCSEKYREEFKSSLDIRIQGIPVRYKSKLKSLGVIFDEKLRFHDHVKAIVQKAYGVIKLLYSNKHVLNISMKKNLCHSLVMSIIGYCDLVYYPCLDQVTKNRIQKIQNACCRLVFGLRKFDSVSQKIAELGWLKIKDLVHLRFVTLVHKLLNNSGPIYLRNKLLFRHSLHNVNIRFKSKLHMPPFTTSIFHRCFTYNAVTLYNHLNEKYKHLPLQKFKSAVRHVLLCS